MQAHCNRKSLSTCILHRSFTYIHNMLVPIASELHTVLRIDVRLGYMAVDVAIHPAGGASRSDSEAAGSCTDSEAAAVAQCSYAGLPLCARATGQEIRQGCQVATQHCSICGNTAASHTDQHRLQHNSATGM